MTSSTRKTRDERPPENPHRKIHAHAGANVWQWAGNNFIHLGDGPRGWVTPLRLSVDGRLLVLPCERGAAVVSVDANPQLIATVPFEGKLRASWISGRRVRLVNAAGQLFASEV